MKRANFLKLFFNVFLTSLLSCIGPIESNLLSSTILQHKKVFIIMPNFNHSFTFDKVQQFNFSPNHSQCVRMKSWLAKTVFLCFRITTDLNTDQIGYSNDHNVLILVVDVEFHPKLHFLTHQPNEPSGNNAYKAIPLCEGCFVQGSQSMHDSR